MKRQWLPYLLLPLGILIGYLIPKKADAPSGITSESPPPRKNRPSSPPRLPDQSLRIRTIIDQADGVSSQDWEQFTESIRQEDIQACLNELLARSGPGGLPYGMREEFDALLGNWAGADFKAAYAWANSIPGEQAKTDLLTVVLSRHAVSDFQETIAIVRGLTDRQGRKIHLGDEFLSAAAGVSAELFAEAVSLSSIDMNDPFEGNVRYPEEFDFKTAAWLIENASKNRPKNEPVEPITIPHSFISEWSKRDTDGALDFYLKTNLATIYDMGQIVGEKFDMSKPAESFPWTLEKISEFPTEQREKFIRNLPGVYQDNSVETLIALANSAPTTAAKQELVMSMLKGFGHSRTDEKLLYADLLTLLPTRELRLRAISKPNILPYVDLIPDATLQTLGISRSDLEAISKQR